MEAPCIFAESIQVSKKEINHMVISLNIVKRILIFDHSQQFTSAFHFHVMFPVKQSRNNSFSWYQFLSGIILGETQRFYLIKSAQKKHSVSPYLPIFLYCLNRFVEFVWSNILSCCFNCSNSTKCVT